MEDSDKVQGVLARIPPVPPEQWPDAFVAALGALPPEMLPPPGQQNNSLSIFAHHPELAAAHFSFYAYFRTHLRLSVRERELIVLRVAWLRRAAYEYTRHAWKNSKDAGITDEERSRVQLGSAAPGWDVTDAALLQATEELLEHCRIKASTWKALAEHFSRPQLMDIVFVVGAYDMYCKMVNAFEVEPEPGFPPLPPDW